MLKLAGYELMEEVPVKCLTTVILIRSAVLVGAMTNVREVSVALETHAMRTALNLATEMMDHIAIRLILRMVEVLVPLLSVQDARSMAVSGIQSARMDIIMLDAASAQRIAHQTSKTLASHARSQLTTEAVESHFIASQGMSTKPVCATLNVSMNVMVMGQSAGDIALKEPQFVVEPCVSLQT